MLASRWRPYVVLFIGVLTVSSSSILIRYAQDDGAGSLVISAWRVTVAALLLTPVVLTRYRADLSRLTRREIVLMAVGGALLGLHFATWITSLEYTSVATSVTLVTSNPLWVALAAPFLLNERLTRNKLMAVIMAVIGGVIISTASGAGTAKYQDAPLLGDGLAIVGAVAIAGYFIVGQKVRSSVSIIPYIWLTYSVGAVVLIAAVVVARQPVTGLAPQAYLWMTLVAVLPQLIGHSSYNYALGYLSAAFVALSALGEPIGSTILAAFLLHEVPVWLQVVGGAMILIAVVIASREEGQRQAAHRMDAAGEPIGVA